MTAILTTKPEPRAVELEFESSAMEPEPRQLELAGTARSTIAMGTTEYTTRVAESVHVLAVAISRAKPTMAIE